MSNQERTVYINGEYLPESQGTLSFRDAGFVYGDAVFDTARTFNGVLFRLDEHLDRLMDSLSYARLDPGLGKDELREITEEVVARNRPLLGENEDYWVSQRISRGLPMLDNELPDREGATVVVECMPLPLRSRAAMFRDGIDAVISPLKRIPPESLSPNAKTNNYLNAMLAQREVSAVKPGAWALQPDRNGNLAEGIGANLFIVKNGLVVTPTTEFVLPGVSRAVVLELCRDNGIPVAEKDVSMQDAAIADEAFFTSTSLCMCPLRSLNGRVYPAMPGPVTKRLMDLFNKEVGMDFAGQYLAHVRGNEAADTGF